MEREFRVGAQLSPYGLMVKEWASLIQGEGSPPEDWQGEAKYWLKWRTDLLALIADILWPTYDQNSGLWSGNSTNIMEELTYCDFELFKNLRPVFEQAVKLPDGPLLNSDLFRIEDEPDVSDLRSGAFIDRSGDATLFKYLLGNLSERRARQITDKYIFRMGKKAGNIDLELKTYLQRPRAFQAAYILRILDFSHQHAKSAVTPSMISGHCFEACMGGLEARRVALEEGFGADTINLIARHTVDVGDRRVFAGVHYASDNIGSWITAVKVAPMVGFSKTDISWLISSIIDNSIVYRHLSNHIANSSASPYKASLDNFINGDI